MHGHSYILADNLGVLSSAQIAAHIQHLSAAQVVKCSARYFASSEKMRACSIGVYAAVAPF